MSNEEKMDKEKKAFIKEQTVVNKKNKIRRYGSRLLLVVVSAVLFGAISSFVFVMSTKWLDKRLSAGEEQVSDSQEEQLPNTTPVAATPTPKPEESNRNKSNKILNLRFKDVQKLFQLLQTFEKEQLHSIVTVSMVQTGTDWFDNPAESKESTYGVIVKKQGNKIFIMTDTDILADSEDKLQVTIEGAETVAAEVHASSKNLHLAILKASLTGVESRIADKVVAAEFAQAEEQALLEPVLLLGKPNGYLHSAQWGSLVTNQLEVAVTDRKYRLYHVDVPQCKGGAGIAMDLQGRIVGVLTTEYEKEAGNENAVLIGIHALQQDVNRLLEGKSLHHLGIQGADMTEEAIEELEAEAGVYVTEVEAGSPAYKAGMRNGDVITELAGEKITSLYELNAVLQSDIVDETVTAAVIRTAGKNTRNMNLKVNCSKLK